MRIAVFRASDTESYLLWTFHHLIIDGWSCPLVFADVGAAYQGLTTGNTGTNPFPANPVLGLRQVAGRPADLRVRRVLAAHADRGDRANPAACRPVRIPSTGGRARRGQRSA